jgi:hypothetical protein
MKMLAIALIALLIALPAVFAATRSYQVIGAQLSSLSRNTSVQLPQVRSGFTGLQGIYGRSIPEPERKVGPQKPFGKPAPKRISQLANLPGGYIGLGGIASGEPGISKAPCEQFSCKPTQFVVGNTRTMEYFRCYCRGAAGIPNESVKCLDTPTIAERLGYHKAGSC